MFVTPSGCVSVWTSAPSAARQSLTVLSGLQLARSCESGLKATRHVVPVCAWMPRSARAETAGLPGDCCCCRESHPDTHRHRTKRAHHALETFDILNTPCQGIKGGARFGGEAPARGFVGATSITR